ncbi:pyroglutamyl-peptidase 1 isoform X1 [Excalfactoria chinensis]|uniref:pyroglutamyl-peptidase 1 isoform X1 n=1 Tax=Excalfactoria chinensis TaxID=46218 RepID=UPI003B3B7BA5
MEKPRRAVVVTGFGPFGEHAVNASWIAVQELEKLGLRDGVDLHVYEVPVEYQTVQRLIPALWKKHSPQALSAASKAAQNASIPSLTWTWFAGGSQHWGWMSPSPSLRMLAGTCVTSLTTLPYTRAAGGRLLFMCLHWESRTAQSSWAGHCRPSLRKCSTFWSIPKPKSIVNTNIESRQELSWYCTS